MARQSGIVQNGENTVFSHIKNDNQKSYSASLVWNRKFIEVHEINVLSGAVEHQNYQIFAEAVVWRTRFLGSMLKSHLILTWVPWNPEQPKRHVVRLLVEEILKRGPLENVFTDEAKNIMISICARGFAYPIFGTTLFGDPNHNIPLKRVQYIKLQELPADHAAFRGD